ncbi:tRNA glutamyl-Q(34) synthetase GluQRS [Roseibium denhamense]|uniref:Glutamyl-Q tRNA(Asp) synthetase n=1 Tax=Roseibium denhamense TaxID=76305 RepID=A0ABY1P9C0_9HYPH|nr:tRNA glutamyl-Q(34) synthetase GluQRS [Roseibium denhamense]MTI07393.1 tRNA glutamyl-Q(34) synthetase GluQRS [Roseibium denhamense]SMP29342.1 glutamyl-Q tRNA(Asp) synthetase [Roseibium denhamense]
MTAPVFRFAPSPNGHLHLGHALSALLNVRASVALSGQFLLRIEDIDQTRCTPVLEADMIEDLDWLGVPIDGPVIRQSECFPHYRAALERLQDLGLVYPAYLTRAEIKRFVSDYEAGGQIWPRDPDGAPRYPGDAAVLSPDDLKERSSSDAAFALRLDMTRALALVGSDLTWNEYGSEGPDLFAAPYAQTANADAWGDVILARKDTPASYHLAVVVDDARQGVTDVLRGKDLFEATSVHRVLQQLLGLPQPRYRHHRLILAEDGRKLSKCNQDTSLRALRSAGLGHSGLRRLLGL